MPQVQIYHNPRCSKSRDTLSLLQQKGINPEVVLYLDTPPDIDTLKDVLKKLGFDSARQLMRRQEEIFKQLQLADETLSEERLLLAMVEHPKLIERPIVLAHGKARLGRPPEQVLEIL